MLFLKHKPATTTAFIDKSTSLYYYGARYYDPELGRFTQADTIVPDPEDPQAFNRYGYARGNPIRYTDPTGHSFWDKVDKWFGKFDKWCYDNNIDINIGGTVYTSEFGPGGEAEGPGGQDDFPVGDSYAHDYDFTYPFEKDLIYPSTVPGISEHTPTAISIPGLAFPATRIGPTGSGAGKPAISDIAEYDPVGAALQVADYQESQELKRRLTWFEETQRWLVEIGGVMEKDHPFILDMQSSFGFTNVVSGSASNVGFLPRGIGVSNNHFLKGGRLFYRWTNQYGGGVKAVSFAKMGILSSSLSVVSVGLTAYTVGATIDSYIHGTKEYIRKRGN